MTSPTLPLPTHRIGVLVPPANPTVEIEYPALAPENVAVHFMRLPIIAGDLQARNHGYVDSYAQALKGFGSLKLDGIAIAMTGPQYRLGYQGDLDLCRNLSDAIGIPVETASLALARALQAQGITRISLLSPYPAWLTEFATHYWKSAGFSIEAIHKFSDELVAYSLSPSAVAEGIRAATAHPDGALLLSGTGMRTLEAIAEVSTQIQIPIVSSNICSVWSITRQLGKTPSAWMQQTLPKTLLNSTPAAA